MLAVIHCAHQTTMSCVSMCHPRLEGGVGKGDPQFLDLKILRPEITWHGHVIKPQYRLPA